MGRKSSARRRAKARAGSGSGAVVNRELNASLSIEAEILTEKDGVKAEEEQKKPSGGTQELILRLEAYRKLVEKKKTSVSREDSILTVGEYSKAVGRALEAAEKCASGGGENGVVWRSALRRLFFCRYNPPLQLWWAFTAAEKNAQVERNADPLLGGVATMESVSKLLVSLKAFSAVNASGNLAVAALAPVVALLHDVATLLHKHVGSLKAKHNDSDSVGGKKTRNVVRKLRETIREILSFIVVCHRRDLPDYGLLTTLPSAEHSTHLKVVQSFYPRFPLASNHIMKSINKNPLNSAVIAEVVSAEVVLLQVLVETVDWRSRLKKQNKEPSVGHQEFVEKIKSLARHSIWTGSTFSISETLLDMLLEKRLPVGHLMDDEEEKVVRECIMETVLVDPPLFGLYEKAGKKNNDLPIILFMKKLAVGRCAIQLSRAQGNRMRADALSKIITSWQTPLQLMKWLQVLKRPLLPVTALLGSQAFLSWVASTSDEDAFKSIFNWCLSVFSTEVDRHDANGESQVNNIEMEEEEEEDLFFVDTAGEAKDDSTDVAADLAFTAAAKDMRKGRTEGKCGKGRGPVYLRLPQGATLVDKKGRKIIQELEESNSDSDAEDLTMMEDSSVNDPRLAEESSSDDEPIARLVDKKKRKKKSGKGYKEELDEKVEEEPIADSTGHNTAVFRDVGIQVTTEQNVEVSEAVVVPCDTIVPSKDEVSGRCEKDIAQEKVKSTPVSAPMDQSTEIQDGQSTGGKDRETAGVQLESSETLPNSEKISKEAKVGASSGPITSSAGKDVDEEMVVASSGLAISGNPPIKPETKSKQDAAMSRGEDLATVENPLPSASKVAETEQETVEALPSPVVASLCKTPGKSKRARKDVDEEMVEASSGLATSGKPPIKPETKSKQDAAMSGGKDLAIVENPLPSASKVAETEQETVVALPSPVVASSCNPEKSKRARKDVDEEMVETSSGLATSGKPPIKPETKSKQDAAMSGGKDLAIVENPLPSASKVAETEQETVVALPSPVVASSCNPEKSKRARKDVDEEMVEASSGLATSGKPPIKPETKSKQDAAMSGGGKDLATVENPQPSASKAAETEQVTVVALPSPVVASSCITPGKSKRARNAAAEQDSESVDVGSSPAALTMEVFTIQKSPSVLVTSSETSSETSSRSKRNKKATGNKDIETDRIAAPAVTIEEDVNVREVSPSIPVTSSGTSSRSKRGKKPNSDTYTVDSVPAEAQVPTEMDSEKQEATPLSTTSEKTSSKSKRGKKATANQDTESVETVISVVSGAPAIVEKDFEMQVATPTNAPDETPIEKSKRGKIVTANEETEAVETVISALPVTSERDFDMQVASPLSVTSGKTSCKSKPGKKADAENQTETVETVISALPVTRERDFDMQVASPLSTTSEKSRSKRGKKATPSLETETIKTVISALPVTTENEFEAQVATPLSTSEKTSSKSKRGKKATADKDSETVENVPYASLVQIEKDHEMQEAVLQSTFLDSGEAPSHIGGDEKVTDDKETEVVVVTPAPAVDDSKSVENLPFTTGTDQNTEGQVAAAVPTTSELTQPSADRDLERMENVTSPLSPSSRKKRGRKPRVRNPESRADLPPIVGPPTRRIATRSTTPHIEVEKAEEKAVDDDEAPIVFVTPHKTPRKSRKNITTQEPLEKVSEDVEAPLSDSGLPSMAEQSEISQGELNAATWTGEVPPPTSVQATASRGRKRSKTQVISEDEDSPTPSVQATPSRSRKKGSSGGRTLPVDSS